MDAGARVPGGSLAVEPHPEPGAGGQREAAVGLLDPRGVRDQPGDPRVGEVVEVLEHLVVAGGDGQVHVGRGADGAADVVRGQQQVVGAGPAGQLAQPGEPAEVGEVGLDDVDQPALEQLPELGQHVQALPGGQRQPGPGPDLAEPGRVVGRHRLLDPGRPEPLQGPGHPDGGGRGEAAVHLHHQLGRGPDGVADGGQDVHRQRQLAVAELGGGGPEGVDLEAPVAAPDHLGGQRGHRLGVAVALVPAVGVGRDPVPEAAAQQPPHRLPGGLAHEVVAGDVDRGQGRLGDLAGPAVLGPLGLPGEPLEVEGVHADHVALGQLVDAGQQGAGLVDHAGLADPPEPVVGDQLDEGQLPPRGADDHRLHADDLHRASITPTPPGPARQAPCRPGGR